MNENRCACPRDDARACMKARHPEREPLWFEDVETEYDDDECSCSCHDVDDE